MIPCAIAVKPSDALLSAFVDQAQHVFVRQGSHVVSVAASGFTPEVPEASLQPLVVEALAKL